MKKLTVWFLGMMITLNLQLTSADEVSEQTHDIDLYIFGEGGNSSTFPFHPYGNLTTTAPNGTTDDYQIYYSEYPSSADDVYSWYSDPLHLNFSIVGDVHFSIWAICNQPRNISFFLSLGKSEQKSRWSFGPSTESKIVHNEPIEFNGIITEEDIEENDLKYFTIGDRIGIDIHAIFEHPQPPAEARVLYNSTNHPSHMMINTHSVSIDISNYQDSNDSASIDVEIIDAFGVYDIADYDVQITSQSGKDIDNYDITETLIIDEGKIFFNISWDKTIGMDDVYTITVTVVDNSGNHWEEEEVIGLNFINDGNTHNNGNEHALSYILTFILICLGTLVMIYIYISRKR